MSWWSFKTKNILKNKGVSFKQSGGHILSCIMESVGSSVSGAWAIEAEGLKTKEYYGICNFDFDKCYRLENSSFNIPHTI